MAEQQECELKFALAGPVEFARALAFWGPAERIHHQVNHYFSDVPGQPSPFWTLRVRQQDDDFELTLKRGRQVVDGYFQASEIEVPLEPGLARRILETGKWPEEAWELEPMQALVEASGRGQLFYLGSMENLRHRCPARPWGVPELDITSFPDGSTDYELEIETLRPEAVRADLAPLAEILSAQTATKFRRFLERRRPSG